LDSKSLSSNLIALGRAYVRLIEAARVIIAYTEEGLEHEILSELVRDYQAALRELLGKVPATTAAEILAASEKILGPVRNGGMN
jgi:hypothetical protein